MGITFNRWNRIIIWCSASIAFLFSLKLVFCGIGWMVLICDLTWLGLRKTSNANKRKKKKENATDEMFWNFIWTDFPDNFHYHSIVTRSTSVEKWFRKRKNLCSRTFWCPWFIKTPCFQKWIFYYCSLYIIIESLTFIHPHSLSFTCMIFFCTCKCYFISWSELFGGFLWHDLDCCHISSVQYAE